MDVIEPTDRTTVRRRAQRGRYERETIHAILDDAPICHIGFVSDRAPVVLPTIHARVGDTLYLHGSTASHMLRTAIASGEICVTATILDGLVLARSAFHHSMNYRSVVVLGRAREVTDAGEKQAAFRAVVEHVLPGRWDEVRAPTAKETAGTLIVAIPITEASAKVRTGPPIDDEEDLDLPIWAGVVPLRARADEPIADDHGGARALPASVRALFDD